MFQRIVVGLDGSQVSETALRMGAELARRLDVPLHLVRVADLAVVHWGASQAAAAYAELSEEMIREKEKAARYLETVDATLAGRGFAGDNRGPIRARGAGTGRCRGTGRPAGRRLAWPPWSGAPAARQRCRRGRGAIPRVGADRPRVVNRGVRNRYPELRTGMPPISTKDVRTPCRARTRSGALSRSREADGDAVERDALSARSSRSRPVRRETRASASRW